MVTKTKYVMQRIPVRLANRIKKHAVFPGQPFYSILDMLEQEYVKRKGGRK